MTGGVPPDMVDLGIGHPDGALLPLAQLRRAAEHRLSIPDTSHLQYGPEEGALSFREGLARFLIPHYGTPVSPDELLITAGASHALDLILSRLCRPGDTIFVEEPTYFFALDVFRDRPVRVVPMATDRQGLDVDALERQLIREVPALVYTIPVFQNPMGVTLPPARRRRLVELARRYGFLIVADEVYQLLADSGAAPAPMRTYGPGEVLSLGSFSKILGPGIRLGWIEGDRDRLRVLANAGLLRSGGGATPFTAAIVQSAIELGIQDEYVVQLRSVYERRRRLMLELLDALLPPSVTFTRPRGGYYVWLEVPGLDTTALLDEARAAGVGFRPGRIFSSAGGLEDRLRLCFTFYDEERLAVGCERLARLLRSRLEAVSHASPASRGPDRIAGSASP